MVWPRREAREAGVAKAIPALTEGVIKGATTSIPPRPSTRVAQGIILEASDTVPWGIPLGINVIIERTGTGLTSLSIKWEENSS